MQNDEVARILYRLRDEIDALKHETNPPLEWVRTAALNEAMAVLEKEIRNLELTPNQMKANSGMYHN